MARRVFFHIGAPKTGTTYLQSALWQHRERLAEDGFLFAGERDADRVWAANNLRDTQRPRKPWQRTAWRRMVRQIQAFDGDALVSHEFLAACETEQASRAIADVAPAEVHVIYTARDLLRQVPALWQEELKFGKTTPLSEYEPAPTRLGPGAHFGWRTLDAAAALKRWSSDLSADRVHVVTVPPPGAPRNLLWRRFTSACGLEPDAYDPTVARPNASMGVCDAELLRRVNGRLSPELLKVGEVHRWVRNFLGETILVGHGGQRFGVSDERARELRAISLRMVAELHSAGYHVIGDLDDLIPPDAPGPHALPDEASDAELLDAGVRTIADLTAAYRDVCLERDRWRRVARKWKDPAASGGSRLADAARAVRQRLG